MDYKQRSKIFPEEKLKNSPSFRDGWKNDIEYYHRNDAARTIQEMGKKLHVSQLCINTGIVFMNRFYMSHSMAEYDRFPVAAACIYLAAKSEDDQLRPLEHVLKVLRSCVYVGKTDIELSDSVKKIEYNLLFDLDFDLNVEHPHVHIVKCTQLLKARREFARMAYVMATDSLLMTPLCVLYEPTVVAAMCINVSSKWSNYEMPLSSDGRPFWEFIDSSMNKSLIDDVSDKFINFIKGHTGRFEKLRTYWSNPEIGSRTVDSGRISESSSSRPDSRPLPAIATPAPAADSSCKKVERRPMAITSSCYQMSKFVTPEKPSSLHLWMSSVDKYEKRTMHRPMMGENGVEKHNVERNASMPFTTLEEDRFHDYNTQDFGGREQQHTRLHHNASLDQQRTDIMVSPVATTTMDKQLQQRAYHMHQQRLLEQRKSSNGPSSPENRGRSNIECGMNDIRKVATKLTYRDETELDQGIDNNLSQTTEYKRQNLKRSSASSAAEQQQAATTVKTNPSYGASSRQKSGKTSGISQPPPPKRVCGNSAHAEISAKFNNRYEEEDQSSKMSIQPHGQAAMNPAHLSFQNNTYFSSKKEYLETNDIRKAPHMPEQSTHNVITIVRTNSVSTASASDIDASLYDRVPIFDSEVPEDLFED